MSVVPIHGRDPNLELRALVHFILAHGDIVGTDHAGRTILQLAVDPWTLDQLAAFDADAEDLEDDGDGEPRPDQQATVLELVPRRVARAMGALAITLLLATAPYGIARSEQAPVVVPLPMSAPIAQKAPQCCRVCKKGKACGDGCISSAKQCTRPEGCACSAPNIGS